MLEVLIRIKIESSEHLNSMIQLAEQMKFEYGHKKQYFFTRVNIDDNKKIVQDEIYSDSETS